MGSARYRCYRISVKYLILKLYLSRLVEQEGCALTLPPSSLLLRVVSSGSPSVRGCSFSSSRGSALRPGLSLVSGALILRYHCAEEGPFLSFRAVSVSRNHICVEEGPLLSFRSVSVSRNLIIRGRYTQPDVHLHVDTNYFKSCIYF